MNHLAIPGISPALLGKRILVVEDEAVVAMLIEDGLAAAGARVMGSAASVAEALCLVEEAIADGGIGTAVLDIRLAANRPSWWPTRWPGVACRSCSRPAIPRTATWAGTAGPGLAQAL